MPDDPPFDSCPIPALPPPVPLKLTVLPTHDCSYLPGRAATHRGFFTGRMAGDLYHRFMDAGFRRSGKVFYQPVCTGCRQCVPVRVPTDLFVPSKSQRRVQRQNVDLTVTVEPATFSDEKYDLYARYLAHRHGEKKADEDGVESFRSFLYDSPVDTVEFLYRDGPTLVGVGICDLSKLSLSSVYFYFDPQRASRSLGTFSGIYEIQWAGLRKIPFYYLGYYVKNCDKMSYKSRFRPAECLNEDGQWRSFFDSPDLSL